MTKPPEGRRESWFGSLSGLARDPRSGRYLAVIDDRQPSRLAWLDITVDDGRLSVRRGEVAPLQPGRRPRPASRRRRRPRSHRLAERRQLDCHEEGHASTGEAGLPSAGVWQPALLTFTSDFTVTRVDPWPERFSLGPASGGVRNNQGFESLTRTPGGRLIAGLEQPLFADMRATFRNGRPFGGGKGGPSRLIELVETEAQWQPRREWIYWVDPTPTREGFEEICNDGENGLTDLLALDELRLIALERSCLQRPGTVVVRNSARLYLVDVSGASDVSGRRARPWHRRGRPARRCSSTSIRWCRSSRPRWQPGELRGARLRAVAPRRAPHADRDVGRQLPRHAEHGVRVVQDGGWESGIRN